MGKKFIFNPHTGRHDIVAGEIEYLQASKANDQYNISTNDNVKFDKVDRSAGSSISLNTSTGIFTLSAGKTYRLTCGLRFEYSDAAKIGFTWYNITNTEEISVLASLRTQSSVAHYSTLPVTQTIFTPTVNTEVTVRCVWEGDGVEDINAGYAWAIIEKMSESIYNVMTVGSIDEKLKRVDTDIWEVAQEGVEYYSPVQQGRRYGIVYRTYFGTSLPSYLTSGNNVSKLIDYCIHYVGSGTRNVARGYAAYENTATVNISLTGVSGNNDLVMGALAWTIIGGWVDYTK